MHPNKQKFLRGFHLIFQRWTAFQLAIQMDWGGPNTAAKAEEFQLALQDYFEKGNRFAAHD